MNKQINIKISSNNITCRFPLRSSCASQHLKHPIYAMAEMMTLVGFKNTDVLLL